ncbi:hypothetical protein NP233_g10359 [Leucocoprinus birnbaumii]|uniref:Uncharacterized protein n=1 Tax=Leucocoprinus birnbaumii TaxID=56174 RepID=A0AAD5VIZ8_9AGAR|nr:hypothetical protein NP233_g10359 [Leucocoprinus birnbaumii]
MSFIIQYNEAIHSIFLDLGCRRRSLSNQYAQQVNKPEDQKDAGAAVALSLLSLSLQFLSRLGPFARQSAAPRGLSAQLDKQPLEAKAAGDVVNPSPVREFVRQYVEPRNRSVQLERRLLEVKGVGDVASRSIRFS